MVRPSFVPPSWIRELRELTRYRKSQVDVRAQEIQRLEKALQDAGIKLTSVASGTWSVSSRVMIEALIKGERDPEVLAEIAKRVRRAKKIDRLSVPCLSSSGETPAVAPDPTRARQERLHHDHAEHSPAHARP